MYRRSACLCVWLLTVSVCLFAQVKTLQSVKISEPPIIDGNLDDSAWLKANIATDFIQNFPNVGQPATQRTVVRVLYDNDAVYIGAYLYDDPELIRKQITARDEEQLKDLDYFSVFFDTYHDLQNGFQFLATSSNVQTDARLSPNFSPGFGEYGDKTWDAVWDSKVSIKKDGWVVEMKIPYISLRFAKKDVQNWGLQFLRSVRRTNETSFWNHVDPQVNGFVNQFGRLDGLTNIQPALRLSFSPYISTGVRQTPEKDGMRNEWLKSGGMDVKYGINESFTLDATLVPDFGQVISDNVVNNLTPYEVRFDDYRPFFTEGTEIFNKSGLFYSRRVGAAPAGYNSVNALADIDPNVEVVRNPGRTQLYNALKLSGRTEKKLGIGVFNAVAAPMYATIRDKTTGEKTRLQTDVLTNYNIVVLDQALKDRSFVTFTNTNVIREGSETDANVTGLDFSLYEKRNMYNVRGFAHYSKVFKPGDDAQGYNTQLRVGKVSGNVQWYLQNQLKSVNYDPTDLGYQQAPNQHINSGSVGYYRYTPTKNFLTYTYRLLFAHRRLYKPSQFTDFNIEAASFWYLRNFWDVSLRVGYLPDQRDYFVLNRPAYDKYARRPEYGYVGLNGSSDSRKRLFFSYNVLFSSFFKNPEKEYHIWEGGLRYRFSDKLTMEVSHRHEAETDYIVYYGLTNGGGNPVMTFVDFKDVTSIFSGIYNFTPRINLTLRVRHYWSNVIDKRNAEVNDRGLPVNEVAAPDRINVNFFNADAFFTWDFKYGSRLILGYKNWLGDRESVDPLAYKRYFSNLAQTFDMRHGNELTIRFIYFLDYNELRRKK